MRFIKKIVGDVDEKKLSDPLKYGETLFYLSGKHDSIIYTFQRRKYLNVLLGIPKANDFYGMNHNYGATEIFEFGYEINKWFLGVDTINPLLYDGSGTDSFMDLETLKNDNTLYINDKPRGVLDEKQTKLVKGMVVPSYDVLGRVLELGYEYVENFENSGVSGFKIGKLSEEGETIFLPFSDNTAYWTSTISDDNSGVYVLAKEGNQLVFKTVNPNNPQYKMYYRLFSKYEPIVELGY